MTSDLPHPPTLHSWRDAEHTPVMVGLPGGEFLMGDTAHDKFAGSTERPAHRVEFTTRFALGRAPVSVGEFRAFRPAHAATEPPNWPVVQVSWLDALAYCGWLTRSVGRRYRLPSEAEWEFACRAGSSQSFACGAEMTPADANFYYDEAGERVGPGKRTPTGTYPANAFGLVDLHGNVSEWVEDAWHPNYIGAPDNGSAWNGAQHDPHVIRGGAWDYLPRLLRSAWRDALPAGSRRDNLGFRVATSDLPS